MIEMTCGYWLCQDTGNGLDTGGAQALRRLAAVEVARKLHLRLGNGMELELQPAARRCFLD